MKPRVAVAAVQMEVKWLESEANARAMASWIARVSSEEPTDLVVFPELATSGYVTSRDAPFMARFHGAAEPIPCPTTDLLGEAGLTAARVREPGVRRRLQRAGRIVRGRVMMEDFETIEKAGWGRYLPRGLASRERHPIPGETS